MFHHDLVIHCSQFSQTWKESLFIQQHVKKYPIPQLTQYCKSKRNS